MKKQKVRKPRAKSFDKNKFKLTHDGLLIIINDDDVMETKTARKLAAWLLKAADYLEQQGEK